MATFEERRQRSRAGIADHKRVGKVEWITEHVGRAMAGQHGTAGSQLSLCPRVCTAAIWVGLNLDRELHYITLGPGSDAVELNRHSLKPMTEREMYP